MDISKWVKEQSDEVYCCPVCGLSFVEEDVTSINENGEDLCPACNAVVQL